MDIFDKIIAGEIPSYKVYEDEDVLAFLDISQVTPGHTLLVPKADVADIFDYTDDIAKKVLLKLPVVAAAIKASNPDITGINIQSNNGVSAGQTVRHSHWHIIPRFDDDNLNSKLAPTIDNSSAFSPERYQKIADSIAAQF
ncbi:MULTISPECIES: HIT family protein [Leuconostoc]|uniref:Diadenosine tetraphosphate hydrolase n=1 Tax=Leuconostoc pseudomesenteroides TaxID=33968 RepID=A0A1X0VGA6_LEUPS|nr:MULTISPECIES: HIT family protein [Leuconostoc]KDA48350.1 Histidine triad (HIT) nucleotide-binding protein [Leuconostoc pseudomesenteroides 1159]KDA50765.1 Histidine triad (HIT) nucleotide-binding protein [Leuconostoc pseudomesenteroides PS12]CCJ67227.1 Histidine triad (HIT) nucleotide-binding protein,similarity with At5g48545 and yeast YDL125C (HNT1) [Leuconostoc pseudomesenteroides 4882]MCT4418648.1 HIT family protein [Leuconostoc falkenbergense]MDG9743947.1 HIT family protein [Leuconostoc